ncbi:CU044_5270 family protein [Nocardioides montaniterrae]
MNELEVMEKLVALRPGDAVRDEWDAAREPVLDGIVHPRRRSRWLAAGGLAVAAATVVAGAVLPAGSPGGPSPSAASVLRGLAVTAGDQGATVGPHQLAYVDLVTEETAAFMTMGENRTGAGHFYRKESHTWTAPEGTTWTYSVPQRGQRSCLARFPAPAPATDSYYDMTSAELAELPTEPAALAAYLDGRPSGDNRGTTNHFGAAEDLLWSGLASPALRAATLRMLAASDGVAVDADSRDDLGRAAVKVTYGHESAFFDPRTSVLLEQRTDVAPGAWARTIKRATDVVDAVPDLEPCPQAPPAG